MGKGPIPSRPHIYVGPNSVIEQVRREIKAFFVPHSVDIAILPPNGPNVHTFLTETLANSKHPPHRQIVLIPHSVRTVITYEFVLYLMIWQAFGAQAAVGYIVKKGVSRRGKAVDELYTATQTDLTTIFDLEWTSVWIDEAHEFRTKSHRGFIAGVAMRVKSPLVVAVTATPLWTAPRVSTRCMRGSATLTLATGHFPDV
jgi:hypothetical protein